MSQLKNQDELLSWSGYQRPADLERWLKNNGISYLKGKDGKIVTTQAAIDHSLLTPQHTVSNFDI